MEIKDLTAKTYCPKCCTALYDTMGASLNTLHPKVTKKRLELVTVVTGNYKDSWHRYNSKAIDALVDELRGPITKSIRQSK